MKTGIAPPGGGRCALLGLSTFVALALAIPAASAETLAEAVALAYQSNPTLQSERAQLRALDEDYVQARAGFEPTAQVQITADYVNTQLGKAAQDATRAANGGTAPAFTEQNQGDGELVVQQDLYTGGRVSAEVREAVARIRAGRAALRATEGNVLLSVIQAYADVLRDQRSLTVRRVSVQSLSDQVDEIQARRRAGEVTLTDVAQAQAQLAAERALYATAQGQLQISRISYATFVGRNPGDLAIVPELPHQPLDIDDAFNAAEAASPDLLQAKWTEEQSHQAIVVARAANRPTLSLRGSFGYTGQLAPFDRIDYSRNLTGEAVFTQPIFTGGLNGSVIRQAIEQNSSDRITIEATRRSVVQNVANAWNQRATARANVVAQAEQVKAADIAYTGERIEYRAGQRSTLDVLVAQETLRDAQLALIAAEHDGYVATASIQRAVGRLEAADFLVGAPLYDPSVHFRSVEHQGATPLSPLAAGLDRIGAPGGAQPRLGAPADLHGVAVYADAHPVGDAGSVLATSVPITPEPGTAASSAAISTAPP